MAKDVDLSSKEWRDIIFEGKNKDFGAYQLRKASDIRHNKAFIFVLIGLAVVSALIFTFVKVQQQIAEREMLAAAAQQEQMAMIDAEEPEEEMEEDTAIAGALDFDDGTDDISKITEQKVEIIQEKPKEKEPEKVFTFVEQKPEFPGGDAALYKFIGDNLVYPPMAIENGVQGRVIVQFVVTKTGAIGNVKVVRSVDRDLDNEAIRVCKKLPNFIPGKQNGQPVNVWYTLPVTFKLQ